MMERRTSPLTRRHVIVAVAVVTVLVLGVLLTRTGSEASTSNGPDSAASVRVSVERAGEPDGDANAPAEDASAAGQEGATAAAIGFVAASQQWLYLSDADITASVERIATKGASVRLAASVVEELSSARTQLAAGGTRVWWLVRPLATKVDGFDATEAQVSVWTVTVLSAAGIAAPQAEYQTVSLDLRWIDGRWLVDDVDDSAGPTPMTGPHDQPWDAEPFDKALDGFSRLGETTVR